MIKSFADKETERLWRREKARSIPASIHRRALKKLVMIDAASNLQDLRAVPGNRLEALKGDRKGEHSIRINDQFRVCFVWQGSDAHAVEVTDYH
jgi:proteic killer suppression protein